MELFGKIIQILDSSMPTPSFFGWYHILSLVVTIGLSVYISSPKRHYSPETIRRIVLVTALVVIAAEIYKQFNYSFSYEDGKVAFDYQWYAFPFQFCSTPMYIGLLAGLTKKGKFHDALCSFLATYALFAGLAVMLYPRDVFISTIGINIQTVLCHGSMVMIAALLLRTGYVKTHISTLWKGACVYTVAVTIAVILNEIAYRVGLLETETFNMFFISPYCEPHLAVFCLIQPLVPFPVELIIYVVGFTAAAGVMLGLARLLQTAGSRKKAMV